MNPRFDRAARPRHHSSMPDFPAILTYAAPAFGLFVGLEWLLVRRGIARGRYDWRDGLSSMAMGVGNLVSDILMGFVSLGFLLWAWQFRLFDLGVGAGVIALALLAQDFVYYWKHRAMHRIRWFWTAHVVHHSSTHYNLSTALRQPWNNHIAGMVVISVPLVLLGFHPLLIAFVGAVNLLYQFWIHTEAIRVLPAWAEFLFNTPSHHRVHHSNHPTHLDKNYGGILIIWDRLFGTFVQEGRDEQITYGLVADINTYNPIRIAFAEMVQALRDTTQRGIAPGQRLGYLFAPPGYSHDGSRQTSEMILAQWQAQVELGASSPGPQTGRAASGSDPLAHRS